MCGNLHFWRTLALAPVLSLQIVFTDQTNFPSVTENVFFAQIIPVYRFCCIRSLTATAQHSRGPDVNTDFSRRRCSHSAAPPRWTTGWPVLGISLWLQRVRWTLWRWWGWRWCSCRSNIQQLEKIRKFLIVLLFVFLHLECCIITTTYFIFQFSWFLTKLIDLFVFTT